MYYSCVHTPGTLLPGYHIELKLELNLFALISRVITRLDLPRSIVDMWLISYMHSVCIEKVCTKTWEQKLKLVDIVRYYIFIIPFMSLMISEVDIDPHSKFYVRMD